jgi:hypothetical protein
MTIQTLLLGFLIATLYGAGFHLYRGGKIWRLGLYLIFAWVGFWGGHLLGNVLGWTFLRIGTLNLGMATLICIAVLFGGYWLSLDQSKK